MFLIQNIIKEGGNMKKEEIERFGFGVMADSDEMPEYFMHSDRFLIIDLKNRKEIIFEEYYVNPHAELVKTKYPDPAGLGDNISDEELQIYMDITEILKGCKYVLGNSLGYYPKFALEKANLFFVGLSSRPLPRDHIAHLIEHRALADFHD